MQWLSRVRGSSLLLPIGFAAGVVAAARFYAHVLPPPWSDEARFLVPAAPWTSGATFDASGLLSADGVYWIPAGFTVFVATWSTLWGSTSLDGARLSSLLLMISAAYAVFAIHRTVMPAAPRSAAAWFGAAWLASAPCVLAANIARPEALVLALSLFALLAALRSQLWISAALAVIAAFVHPLLAVPALAQVLLAPNFAQRARPTRAAWILTGVALALAALELWLFVQHHQTYVADWAFQLARKQARKVGVPALLLASILAAGVLALPLLRKRLERRHTTAFLVLVSLAYALVQAYGQEMWYTPFTASAVAVGLLAIGAALGSQRAAAGSAALMFAAVLLGWGVGLRKGTVQGIPVRPDVLSAAAADQRELQTYLSTTIGASETPTFLAADLAAPFVSQIQSGRLFTDYPRSDARGAEFGRAIYPSQSYPYGSQRADEIAVLAGYSCERATQFRTQHGYYAVVVAMLERTQPGAAGAPFVACQTALAAWR